MESESDAAGAPSPEQELADALLSLSWPLPRTVEDADAALTRLEEVKAVLVRLEQQSVGSDAWWAGQVDALATQSGFVLEWWRPVLRDPDLDWTLNHQAHLTADLATLASAGARLLDQIEPRGAEEAEAAAHARRVAQDKRWGPTAVPPFPPPAAAPKPPAEVFGTQAAQAAQAAPGTPEPSSPKQDPATIPAPAAASAPPPIPTSTPPTTQPAAPAFDAPPVAAPPTAPAQAPAAPSIPAQPVPAAPPSPQQSPIPESPPGSARHRRPAYDFDDPRSAAPATRPYPQPHPQSGPPRSPLVPGPGFGGPPQGRTLAPGGHPPPANASHSPYAASSAPFGFVGEDEDDDESDSLVPAGLRRHQRRLLIQTGVILGAIGVLCWWAASALGSPSSHTSAAGEASTHPADTATATSSANTAAGGLTTDHTPSATPSKTAGASPSPSAAPSTATSSVPDGTTVSSVRVTLLGGSATVPQIVALITVDTAGTGHVTVTGAYYGASGSKHVAAETERWTLSGKTTYQYSVPIANSAYCGTEFHFTASAGGHTASDETGPGC